MKICISCQNQALGASYMGDQLDGSLDCMQVLRALNIAGACFGLDIGNHTAV